MFSDKIIHVPTNLKIWYQISLVKWQVQNNLSSFSKITTHQTQSRPKQMEDSSHYQSHKGLSTIGMHIWPSS